MFLLILFSNCSADSVYVHRYSFIVGMTSGWFVMLLGTSIPSGGPFGRSSTHHGCFVSILLLFFACSINPFIKHRGGCISVKYLVQQRSVESLSKHINGCVGGLIIACFLCKMFEFRDITVEVTSLHSQCMKFTIGLLFLGCISECSSEGILEFRP